MQHLSFLLHQAAMFRLAVNRNLARKVVGLRGSQLLALGRRLLLVPVFACLCLWDHPRCGVYDC